MARRKLPPGVSVRENKSGTKYRARISVAGENRWVTVHGVSSWDTPEEAYAARVKALEDVKGPKRDRLTVAEFYERWTRDPGPYTAGKATSTNRHNKERAKLFVEDHGDKLLVAVDRPLARDWITANPGRGPSVRLMFSDAAADGLVPANPFAGLRVPGLVTKSRKHIQPLTEPEVEMLADCVEAIENEEYRPMFRACIIFTAYSGLRIGEMSALRWQDVDFAKGTITVSRQWRTKDRETADTKTGNVRVVVLFDKAQAALRSIMDLYGTQFSEAGDDLVFAAARGDRLNHRNHYYYWRTVRAWFLGKIGDQRVKELDGVHWHDLRHFTASWLVDRQVPAPDVAYQLGHDDGGRLVQKLYGHRYVDSSLRRLREADQGGGSEAERRAV